MSINRGLWAFASWRPICVRCAGSSGIAVAAAGPIPPPPLDSETRADRDVSAARFPRMEDVSQNPVTLGVATGQTDAMASYWYSRACGRAPESLTPGPGERLSFDLKQVFKLARRESLADLEAYSGLLRAHPPARRPIREIRAGSRYGSCKLLRVVSGSLRRVDAAIVFNGPNWSAAILSQSIGQHDLFPGRSRPARSGPLSSRSEARAWHQHRHPRGPRPGPGRNRGPTARAGGWRCAASRGCGVRSPDARGHRVPLLISSSRRRAHDDAPKLCHLLRDDSGAEDQAGTRPRSVRAGQSLPGGARRWPTELRPRPPSPSQLRAPDRCRSGCPRGNHLQRGTDHLFDVRLRPMDFVDEGKLRAPPGCCSGCPLFQVQHNFAQDPRVPGVCLHRRAPHSGGDDRGESVVFPKSWRSVERHARSMASPAASGGFDRRWTGFLYFGFGRPADRPSLLGRRGWPLELRVPLPAVTPETMPSSRMKLYGVPRSMPHSARLASHQAANARRPRHRVARGSAVPDCRKRQ